MSIPPSKTSTDGPVPFRISGMKLFVLIVSFSLTLS
jgi:hypothetical protein